MPRESKADKKKRTAAIIAALARRYPDPRTALHYSNPLELLVATILSAQCTDERVNKVTPSLFDRYPEAADYASAPAEELEGAIHSTGFFRAKARSIQGTCRILAEKHGGEVPKQMEELVERLVRWDIHPADLVTHRFPVEKAGEAYALMASGKCGKVAVCFDEEL